MTVMHLNKGTEMEIIEPKDPSGFAVMAALLPQMLRSWAKSISCECWVIKEMEEAADKIEALAGTPIVSVTHDKQRPGSIQYTSEW